jgi:hypothetical protein
MKLKVFSIGIGGIAHRTPLYARSIVRVEADLDSMVSAEMFVLGVRNDTLHIHVPDARAGDDTWPSSCFCSRTTDADVGEDDRARN